MADTRTLAALAREALDVQDACNLSGVVHGWSRAIKRLRELRPELGTDALNHHPVNVMWADTCAHLTNSENGSWYSEAYHECLKVAAAATPDLGVTPEPLPDICPF